ncbi:MAG: type I-C CRISPR-associated protein Cas8c/Csd1 [Nitrosomonas sp.]|nr:type I-C CRISPR-associated protein Cas8c/Csd1 [Nitrosomonas sp.]
MILNSLAQYYQRLADMPDAITGLARVPSYGFSEERISYILVLSCDGRLLDIQNHMNTSGKKPLPKLVSVPRPEKRTVNVKSNFLWDKTAYVLGVEGNKDKATAQQIPWIVAEKNFDAFKQLHLAALWDVDDAGLKALKVFLQNWHPEHFNQPPCSTEMIDTNLVFKLDGETQFLHQGTAAKNLWAKMVAPEEIAVNGQCLLTGESLPIARLHPSIKGGYLTDYGGQPGGCSMVSFNKESFTSFGKEKGGNAPVSEWATFAYTTALNYLLRRKIDKDHSQGNCLSVGDSSTVFWAVASDGDIAHEEELVFANLLIPPSVDDGQEATQIAPLLIKIAQGRPLNEFAPNINPETRFFVLGLTPNVARLSIRYWLDTTFGYLANNICQHYHDLLINPLPWREPPSIWRLLIQTVAHRKNADGSIKKPEYKHVPPQLAGELMRAIITGQSYPRMLLAQLIQRIRSDGDISGIRVAMIKAIIQRDFRKGLIQEEVPMSLDLNITHIAYRLGRLFAAIERIQEAALGRDLNSTVTDKYYGTASTVPFSVFPRLLSGSQNHLTKLRKDKPGYAVNLKKDLAEIIAGIENSFPRHLSVEEQGRFAIGYYHQKQSYFESSKKTDAVADESNESTNN